jgi:Uma2 family endonuclease
MNSIFPPQEMAYPESDGKPMADNTLQFQWIVTLQGNLDAMYRDHPQVFVAGDLLWYPVEGNNRISAAPDVMVVFGRPKGHRGSYLQWQESHVGPQVVFEVLSPSNRPTEMVQKFQFYERHGVEEYYLLDPNHGTIDGWLRTIAGFERIEVMDGWISPRLKVRFEATGQAVNLYHPDDSPFLSYVELHEISDRERARADTEHERAEKESQRAEKERERAERLAARLRELGQNPE